MAFEIIHAPRRPAGQSPARRLSSRLFAAMAILALIWACAVAYTAQPIEPEQGRSKAAHGIDPNR
ncbi:hypothetical protein [uncultured Rhodoblastus sp.]|uniref:hypothetical protein n=1 Tax=uncultured Rhodoblastus sp. TaxID=543037 RepID=UPI0025F7AFDE|nr:hypothetical protein [uncultured Rhodoblastus sp.]